MKVKHLLSVLLISTIAFACQKESHVNNDRPAKTTQKQKALAIPIPGNDRPGNNVKILNLSFITDSGEHYALDHSGTVTANGTSDSQIWHVKENLNLPDSYRELVNVKTGETKVLRLIITESGAFLLANAKSDRLLYIDKIMPINGQEDYHNKVLLGPQYYLEFQDQDPNQQKYLWGFVLAENY